LKLLTWINRKYAMRDIKNEGFEKIQEMKIKNAKNTDQFTG